MMVTNRIEQKRVNVTSFDDPQHQETTRKREKKHCFHTGRKNGFTERQRWSQTRDKGHLCTSLTRDKCSVRIWLHFWLVSKVWSQPLHFWLHLWRASKVKSKLPAYLTTTLIRVKGIAKHWFIWLHLWRASKEKSKLLPIWLHLYRGQRSKQRGYIFGDIFEARQMWSDSQYHIRLIKLSTRVKSAVNPIFRPLSFDDPQHQETTRKREKKNIPFTLSLYNGYFEGSYWPNKNCWEVTFSKMQHTRTEIHPLKGNLVNFHMQISSRQS